MEGLLLCLWLLGDTVLRKISASYSDMMTTVLWIYFSAFIVMAAIGADVCFRPSGKRAIKRFSEGLSRRGAPERSEIVQEEMNGSLILFNHVSFAEDVLLRPAFEV